MIEIETTRMGAHSVRLREPLPPYTRPEEILADSMPILETVNRMSVTDAAERYVRVETQGTWQSIDRMLTPYMVEPADMTGSRRFKVVAFVGPSQSGKTVMLQTSCLHRVMCDPMPVQVIHMSRPERDKWVEHKLDPIVRNSPRIHDLLGKGRDDSTFSRKRFRGTRVEIGYPTAQQLSGGTYGLVAMTDFDHFPVMMGTKDSPEGTPYRMARQRIRTYLSRGCVLVESTPAHPWEDPSWHNGIDSPHMLPPTTAGIVNIYNEGTRGRWYWQCPDCDGLFEPRFDRLVYDGALDPGEAGAVAEMGCPHCGALIAHRHKVELNRRALAGHGGWLHEGQAVDGIGQRVLVPIDDSAVRRTDVASYSLDGAAATFANWAELVANYEAARRKAEDLNDDSELSGVFYTEIGKPYRGSLAKDAEIGLQFLKDHAQATPRGVLPEWVRFVTVSVDVQDNRFPVQVTAWGEGGRAQVVDRYDLVTPPAGAPNTEAERSVQPPRYGEDWAVLEALGEQVWPVAGAAYGLRAIALVVDFQGSAGVSDNAEAFWRGRRAAGLGKRWFVSRGRGGFKLPGRVWLDTPERGSKGKKARSIKILNIATDRVKDTISAAIGKVNGDAAGAFYTALWMSDDQHSELLAEERGKDGWEKRRGQIRNESFDLSVQARALAEYLGLLRITDWDAAPGWAAAGPLNSMAVALSETAAPATAAKPARRRRRVQTLTYLRR
ncbi:terminase gpA endonuclease subunit [Thioclava litoralis]|uniref:Terminase gpA endonuclease subunit n=1 Tax=Thioclava litoralis TaxID=3076557 RepID=A0ABZ1DYH8_9RHOB|nr:terminase gpA endonuclease subunit [Thioclava sp. FTW29]